MDKIDFKKKLAALYGAPRSVEACLQRTQTTPHSQLSSSGLTGRSSIPETAVIESIGRGVLDARMRGHDRGGRDCLPVIASLSAMTPGDVALSTAIVREGGRSSIPETSVIESISRGVLDGPHARA